MWKERLTELALCCLPLLLRDEAPEYSARSISCAMWPASEAGRVE
jgi:hypothetical protein